MLVIALSPRYVSEPLILKQRILTSYRSLNNYVFLQAGPGTIAEATIRGLPIILNDYIAGQVVTLFQLLALYTTRENS